LEYIPEKGDFAHRTTDGDQPDAGDEEEGRPDSATEKNGHSPDKESNIPQCTQICGPKQRLHDDVSRRRKECLQTEGMKTIGSVACNRRCDLNPAGHGENGFRMDLERKQLKVTRATGREEGAAYKPEEGGKSAPAQYESDRKKK
jgi:hypothetical protein